MKKYLYIALFIFLGFLVQLFMHASLEVAYSLLLWREFERWSLGLTYAQLWMVHNVLTYIFLVLGLWLGYRSGKFWWTYLYQDNGELKPEFRKSWRF